MKKNETNSYSLPRKRKKEEKMVEKTRIKVKGGISLSTSI